MADDLMPAQFGHVRFSLHFPFALGNREPNAHEHMFSAFPLPARDDVRSARRSVLRSRVF
jgi:hypothetical protein